jgi:PadR family transcriptional regulator PadR
MARDGLGDLERRVLLAIHHLHGQGYAVSIAQEMAARFGRTPSLGAVYTTVDRLEKKRFVSSSLGDATPERGGKPKRYYRVEALGQLALVATREAEARLWGDELPQGGVA